VIYENNVIDTSDTDVLNGTRLNAIPYNGTLTVDVSVDINTDLINASLTVQLPNGDVPIDSQRVVANGDGAAGVLDERTLIRFTFPATQGGHFNISLILNGAVTAVWRAVLRP